MKRPHDQGRRPVEGEAPSGFARGGGDASPHKVWMEYAESDLAFAKAGLRDGFFAHVCVLSQQAVEKAMKGYLVFLGKSYPKSHRLLDLLALMEVDWLASHVGSIKKIAEFYVPLRYPDAAGVLPGGPPSESVAKKTLEWAEKIVAEIKTHLK